MNPCSHSSVHTSIDAYAYASPVASGGTTISYLEHTPSFYEDPSSAAEGWSYVGLAEWSDADRALLEALVTVEVTNASPPSGSLTLIPMQSPPSYSPGPNFLYDPTGASCPHAQSLDGSQLHPSGTVMSTVLSTSEHAQREMTASDTAFDVMYPSQLDAFAPQTYCSPAAMPHAFHASSFSYPSPSPEPSLQASSIDIAPQRRHAAVHASHPHISFAFKQPPPSEPAGPSISPDLVYPSAHCGYDLEDDHSTDVSFQSSHGGSRRASRRTSPSAPYPSPSLSPSPRTPSTIIASQRRNVPAHTRAAPAASNAWQCPYCPYVQRNRRSPDLKRHVKTHTRDANGADWVCCGVPVLNAIEQGVPATTLREAQVFEFDGVLMVGGCRKAFSRRDALRRHLQRERGRCFGDASSLYQPGNRESC